MLNKHFKIIETEWVIYVQSYVIKDSADQGCQVLVEKNRQIGGKKSPEIAKLLKIGKMNQTPPLATLFIAFLLTSFLPTRAG